MSESRERLAAFLVDGGWAESLPGYGHATGDQLADAILASDWYADHTFQLRRCNEARKQQLVELEALRAQVAAERERIATAIEERGRAEVAWLASTQTDRLDSARIVGAEDAYRDAIRIARSDP